MVGRRTGGVGRGGRAQSLVGAELWHGMVRWVTGGVGECGRVQSLVGAELWLGMVGGDWRCRRVRCGI